MGRSLQYMADRPGEGCFSESRPAWEYGEKWLTGLVTLLQDQTGHDFSTYKKTILCRRIDRRMKLNHISDPDQYVSLLQNSPKEAAALSSDLLIGATRFFRDPESFEILKTHFFSGIVNSIEADGNLRVWIPGCSTGEEMYSMAIILYEYLETVSKPVTLQLFGTDIDPRAIETARKGRFPEKISAFVTPERLNRYFTREEDGFRVRKIIRNCVVFSVHDLLKEPPFSRLHLVSCRNLLIYLNTDMQTRLFSLFHYTLRENGILVLGGSEAVTDLSDGFKVLDRQWRIYQKQPIPLARHRKQPGPEGQALVCP